ncbi:putative nuclease HARBI1 [Bactrocera dorsalis]|uniref:Nuclease HARBI1 n=1 Tax=Bactrocera dorsalis TaxID=27457 RepID=A0A6I9V7H1_BACDO|nr:putative nuclease HARBI1 [Bactrocera dorsalis]XP_049306083.1 putative nuclease HARBI1 [Bactrocera dorsalis]XP_049307327.1 putative nuclease HARBI1 [Bactrocera dorsalis]XP_049310322.1 putative nuclease HARBI1 [Bactrocera dorsalis]
MNLEQLCTFVFENALELGEKRNSSNVVFIKKILNKRKRRRVFLTGGGPKRKIPKTSNFCKTIKCMQDDVFYAHFRMKKSTFKNLQTMLMPWWPSRTTGRIGISLEKALQIAIWKLSNNCSFRDVSDRFGVAVGLAYKVFVKIIKMICRLKKDVIKFPRSEAEQKQTSEAFSTLRFNPFPFVLGCVDGTHIPISQPIRDEISYRNRKGTYSIIAQAIVDSRMKFIDVFIGCPGACHDASIWQMSPIKKAIINKEINIYPNYHFLGDGGYPLEMCVMVPYRDNGFLTPMQSKYNAILSSTRVVVEQAFGVLKKKFRILKYIEVQNPSLPKLITMACMIIHNIIIINEGNNADDLIAETNAITSETLEEVTLPGQREAKAKRDALATLLSA